MPATRTIKPSLLGAFALASLAAGCGDGDATREAEAPAPASTPAQSAPSSSTPPATTPRPSTLAPGATKVIAKGLQTPWDIAFLPDGDALVTERDKGDILRIPAGGGQPEVWTTVDGVVPGGEGGLLGIAVDPDFEAHPSVYVYFTAADDNRVAIIDADTKEVTPIVTGIQKASNHDGGALSFGPDGDLYAGVGEAGNTVLAQDKASLNGKILRFRPRTGKAVASAPFNSLVYSYGHRNVQGIDWDGDRMWASEFGQNTTDEVNIIGPGKNYGWPDVEGKGGGEGYTDPVVTWSPTSSSSPSGLAVAGDHLYVGALAGQKLWQIPIDGAKAGTPKALFDGEYGRIRGVVRAPDGSVWFTTSNTDGRGDPGDDDDQIIQLGT